MKTLTPFTVTARLQQGVVLDALFGTALDGLLASVVRDRAKAEAAAQTGTVVTGSLLDGGLHETAPASVALPLGRCGDDGAEDWHWLCTTAHPVGWNGDRFAGDTDVHYQHSRIRERVLEHVSDRIPASLPPASGRYRLRRMPVVSTPATALVWRGVGDLATIEDLLSGIPAIGRRRGTGEGTVLEWVVAGHPGHDPARFGHLHPDTTLGRPTPLRCLPALALTADRTGTAGIRPPYWHPATQRVVALPEPL